MSNKFTDGPWTWWTSNSHARLTHETDGDVLSAYRASDGLPCVSVSEPDMALIAQSPAMYEALEKSTRYLIGERDRLKAMANCGYYYDPNDRDAVAELDKLINDNQEILKAAGRQE